MEEWFRLYRLSKDSQNLKAPNTKIYTHRIIV